MLFSVEQAFVGRDEKGAPLKTPAREATKWRACSQAKCTQDINMFQEPLWLLVNTMQLAFKQIQAEINSAQIVINVMIIGFPA